MEFFAPIFILLFSIGIFAGYVICLVNAAQTSQWVWFVLMLLIWPTCLLYYFVGYES